MTSLVDCDIGRKVDSFMISLGFTDVHLEVEADKIFTVIGQMTPKDDGIGRSNFKQHAHT